MNNFRFAIMGAANIANKFCDAVNLLDGCEVIAVASKSQERAQEFAKRNNLPAAYGDYEEMLRKEKPDCVYIAVTTNDHYRLSMLCLDYKIPVLCEKAMFRSSQEAETVLKRAKELQVFVMEATWSRFLPPIRQAKTWIDEGMLGTLRYLETRIGFLARKDDKNRYFNKDLGGGAAFDLTIYTYELAVGLIDQPILDVQVNALWGKTDVDVTEHILLRCPDMLVSMTTGFLANMDQSMVIYGEKGRLVIPKPHMAEEAYLYDASGALVSHFKDDRKNGFIFEIQETMDCIRAGKIESPIVPHALTLSCARLFDRIAETNRPECLVGNTDAAVSEDFAPYPVERY